MEKTANPQTIVNSQQIVDPRREKMKSRIAWGIAIFFACIWVVVTVGPFIFMVVNSFRDRKMMGRQGVLHFPDPWYFQNYPDVISNGLYVLGIWPATEKETSAGGWAWSRARTSRRIL